MHPGRFSGILTLLRVIALSGRPEARQAALEAGASAFVSKGDPPEFLLEAIRKNGGPALDGVRKEKEP